ncbi:MAG: FecR family protein [Candidatus Sericytochromatia bacterium]
MSLKNMALAGLLSVLALSPLTLVPAAEGAGAAATVTHVFGSLQVRTNAGWRGSVPSQRLFPGMTLRTGDRSRGQIRYDDGSVVRLGSRTVLRVREARDLRMMRGKAWVQKQKNGQKLRIRTPVAQATVLGTELFVSHNDENRSHVTTLTGLVQVENEAGETTMVEAGMWVEIEPGKPLEAPTKFDWNELKKTERFLLDLNFVPAPDEPIDDGAEWM